MHRSWIPPIKITIHAMDGQPKAEPPNKSCLTIIKIMARKEMIHINIPVKDASFNGAVEKDIIPSKE